MANDLADDKDKDESEPDKATVTLPGTVEKIIPAVGNLVPEQAQINIEGAEDLYREVRIENTMQDGDGNDVSLKKGAEVEVIIKADPDSVKPKAETTKP
jgi:hypothetical protein